uniref:Uncharacterized protein n=1 Tax=Curvibacter symbiont subsp. Hydra magnipapillata TaxID=667019 RepID=C9YBM1_CURXX|nr:hypothetical protein Csp_A15220 [Curvibacter putative symbiont of Hydra magnipapillata]
MRKNELKKKAQRGELAINAWVSMGSSYLAEILGHTGFDSVTVDLQHGVFGFDTAVQLLQAISSTPAIPIARSSDSSLAQINKLLGCSAYASSAPLLKRLIKPQILRDLAVSAAWLQKLWPPETTTRADYPSHADDEI